MFDPKCVKCFISFCSFKPRILTLSKNNTVKPTLQPQKTWTGAKLTCQYNLQNGTGYNRRQERTSHTLESTSHMNKSGLRHVRDFRKTFLQLGITVLAKSWVLFIWSALNIHYASEHLTEQRENKHVHGYRGQHEVSSKCCPFHFDSSTHNCYINHLQQDKNK